MRNFIPKSDNNILPLEIQCQFETLQHALQEKKQHHSDIENEMAVCISEDTLARMALSTAISVQREIDGLLNGIAELENMLSDDICPPFSYQKTNMGSFNTKANRLNQVVNPRKNVEKEGNSVIK